MPTEQLHSFTKNDFEVIEREVLYDGFFRMVRCQLKYRLFQGNMSNVVRREIMERPSAAAILPYDPILDRVVLIEQFRPGAMRDAKSPWIIEIVAGILQQPEETPSDVVKREAIEEAGCHIQDIFPVSEYFVSPGGSDEYIWVFCGNTDASNVDGIYGVEEENENIRVFTLTLDEAIILLQEGHIRTSPAIIALQWLQLNREWLKTLWQTK